MVYETDVSILIDNNVSVKDYLFCKMIQNNDIFTLIKYLKVDAMDTQSIENLIKKGWVKGEATQITTLTVTDKFKNLGNSVIVEDMFDEFLRIFPAKVTRPDGSICYLRTDQKNCRSKYHRITKGKRLIHDMIITALMNEIKIKTKNNSIKYFKTMPNWLKSEEWQTYLQIQADETSNKATVKAYGTNLL